MLILASTAPKARRQSQFRKETMKKKSGKTKWVVTIIILLAVLGVQAELMLFSGFYSVQFDLAGLNYQGIPSLAGSYQFRFDLDDIPDTGSFEVSGLVVDQFVATPNPIGSTLFAAQDMQLSIFGDFGDWNYFRFTPVQGFVESADYLSLTFEVYNGYDPVTTTYTNALDWVDLNVSSEVGYFQGDQLGTDYHGAVLDGTITVQAIPEPNSVALFLLGALGVIYARRATRCRNKKRRWFPLIYRMGISS